MTLICIFGLSGCNKAEEAAQAEVKVENEAAEASKDEKSTATVNGVEIEGYDEPEEQEFESEEDSEATYELFEDFLGIGNGKDVKAIVDKNVQVGYDDWDMNYEGKSFSLKELNQLLKDSALCGITKSPEMSYIFFPSIGMNDLLAVKFTNVGIDGGEDDGSTTVMIFANRDGKLYLTHCYNGWSRCYSELSDIGLCYSSGSSGAGAYSVEYGCFQESGQYEQIYMTETLFDAWIGMDFDQEAFEEAYNPDGENNSTYMVVQVTTIDNETYYSYDFQEGYSATEEDKKFIDITTKNGTKWQNAEEMNEIISERLESLGLGEEFLQIEEGSWESL